MQASDSPGGNGENATHPEFPKGTMPELCDKCASAKDQDKCKARCLTEHTYETQTFDDPTQKAKFNHDTDTAIPADDTKMDVDAVKLDPLEADTAYSGLAP